MLTLVGIQFRQIIQPIPLRFKSFTVCCWYADQKRHMLIEWCLTHFSRFISFDSKGLVPLTLDFSRGCRRRSKNSGAISTDKPQYYTTRRPVKLNNPLWILGKRYNLPKIVIFFYLQAKHSRFCSVIHFLLFKDGTHCRFSQTVEPIKQNLLTTN